MPLTKVGQLTAVILMGWCAMAPLNNLLVGLLISANATVLEGAAFAWGLAECRS